MPVTLVVFCVFPLSTNFGRHMRQTLPPRAGYEGDPGVLTIARSARPRVTVSILVLMCQQRVRPGLGKQLSRALNPPHLDLQDCWTR